MTFKNRQDAGIKLAKALIGYGGENTILLALPRGGVPVAYEVAKALKVPLELIIARKIGHPSSPEYAIGAVTESGTTFLNESEIKFVTQKWLSEKINDEVAEAKRRRILYLGNRKQIKLRGKIVIVIDDGVATGLTMKAALQDIRRAKPKQIIVALPVAPKDTVEALKKEADKVLVLYAPEEFFGAVGQYYEDFPQVTDEEVLDIMRKYSSVK